MDEARAHFYDSFLSAQAKFPVIAKTKTVDTGTYSYKYADLPSILEAVLPILHGNDIGVSQSVISEEGRVGVETRLFHISGHCEVFGPVFLNAGNDPRAAGSAVTYARRYSLCAALGIAADEDDDGRAVEVPVGEDAGAWLGTQVQMFAKWTEAERRETVTQVMAEQGIKNPMSRQEAERVFEKASAIYYETHPPADDEAPF